MGDNTLTHETTLASEQQERDAGAHDRRVVKVTEPDRASGSVDAAAPGQ